MRLGSPACPPAMNAAPIDGPLLFGLVYPVVSLFFAMQVADEHHWAEMRALILVVSADKKDTSSTSGKSVERPSFLPPFISLPRFVAYFRIRYRPAHKKKHHLF